MIPAANRDFSKAAEKLENICITVEERPFRAAEVV
jgi:hypothetical protein